MQTSSLGFARVAAASVRVHVGNVEKNKAEILNRMKSLQKAGVRVALFPEMCLTGYTVGDLVNHSLLQKAATEAMLDIASQTADMAVIVGLPIAQHGRLFNCAAVLQGGEVRGIVPKTYLPNGNEFYETRWFVGGEQAEEMLESKDFCCAFGSDLLFNMGDFLFAVEICEDLWTPIPPSCKLALEGADIIFNPSASNALAGKHAYRRELLKQQSARLFSGYVYAGAGFGESTSDLVFCGYTGVYENGRALAEGKRFTMAGDSAVADVDIERLRYQRQRSGSFHQVREHWPVPNLIEVPGADSSSLPLRRTLEKFPFVPKGDMATEQLEEIARIQTTGLTTRLNAIGCKRLVVGVSGGLDSTLALLVAARAFDTLGLPRAGIYAITLPGMGTGQRTKSNADRLMAELSVTRLEISIASAVRQHFSDIGHEESIHDVTYENSQARERTQILMDYAGKVGGIVLGTGDMSELALGYCTYNGDHMSMYNVNCSVPKTLVRLLVAHLGAQLGVLEVCQDVIDTPISPELLPVTDGELNQKTETILGSYDLHDFFLYHLLDSGSSPKRLLAMAMQAFGDQYDSAQIEKQLGTFLKRFFSQQFKRNCVPDGPKVGSISLSPRGDLRMPSDMDSMLWLEKPS